jgi:hypothetical protein
MPKVMMLGGLRPSSFGDATSPVVPPANAPPSSYAIHDLVNNVPGALPRVMGLTLLRSAFILPGLYVVGVRGWKHLMGGAAAASVSITLSMLILCALKSTRDG